MPAPEPVFSAQTRDGVLWPHCGMCGEAADLQLSENGTAVAKCCDVWMPVRLAYVDARVGGVRLTPQGLKEVRLA